jgi:hypothetical protein
MLFGAKKDNSGGWSINQLFGSTFGKSSFFTSPVTQMKWFILKVLGALLALKIVFANAHLLFTRSNKQPVYI